MNKRASLTPKQRREMYEAQAGLCAACSAPAHLMHMIAEHWFPVALGNPKKPDCLLCIPCADRKTNGTKATTYGSDKHAIAKVKRLQAASILHGWHMGESVRETADRLSISSYRVREVRYRQRPKARKLEGQGFQSNPENHKHQWPSRSLPSKPMRKEGRNL